VSAELTELSRYVAVLTRYMEESLAFTAEVQGLLSDMQEYMAQLGERRLERVTNSRQRSAKTNPPLQP